MRSAKPILAACTMLAALTMQPAVATAGPNFYNDAQAAFGRGDIPGGLVAIGKVDPDDDDAAALQAMWADFVDDWTLKGAALSRLDEPRRAQVEHALRSVATAATTPPNPFPSIQGPRTAIVVLGMGLLPDGSIRPEHAARLQAAWVQAVAAPFSPIVVTGGMPQNGVTEAEAMRRWLTDRLIPAQRIHVENRSGSTVENAIYSADLLKGIGADSAVVVTSANHIRRATADFSIAGIAVIGAMSTVDGIVPQLMPVAKPLQRGMYADATRVLGLPARR